MRMNNKCTADVLYRVAGVSPALLGHKMINGFPFLQSLLHVNKEIDSIHHSLNQLHLTLRKHRNLSALDNGRGYLRFSKPVNIGDVVGGALGCSVHSPSASLLQPQLLQNISKPRVLGAWSASSSE